MSSRVETSLRDRSQRPARAPSASLHERIMDGLEGEPEVMAEQPGGVWVGTGALAVIALLIVVVVLTRPDAKPVGGDDAVARGMSEEFSRVPEGFGRLRSAMTSPLEREAEHLKSDASAILDGLLSRMPLL